MTAVMVIAIVGSGVSVSERAGHSTASPLTRVGVNGVARSETCRSASRIQEWRVPQGINGPEQCMRLIDLAKGVVENPSTAIIGTEIHSTTSRPTWKYSALVATCMSTIRQVLASTAVVLRTIATTDGVVPAVIGSKRTVPSVPFPSEIASSNYKRDTLSKCAAMEIARVGTAGSANRNVSANAQARRKESCASARRGLAFYRNRHVDHLKRRGATSLAGGRSPRNCADARYLASVARSRAFAARQATQRWIAQHVLRDYRAEPGNQAWRRAVREAQKPYPGTEAWLLSCSASEGGWGRWVPNSQGSGVGGWLQFHPGTFSGFFWRARVDVASRAFIVPASAASWYSPLGQALAGGWAITNGMRHHWVGSGC